MADISKIKIPGSSTEYNVKDTVSGYVSTEATTSAKGLMSAADKTKLNGIASGAEVNQQAFSNVVVGTTTIAADSKTDTLTLVAGDNVTLTPNAAEDTITISSSSAGTVSTIKVGDTSYSPTSGIISLPAYPTTLPASDTVSTYSSTGTAPVNGKAVAAALGTLDGTVSGTAGVGKTLTAFSQTDGKVSATFGDISITKSQVSDFPTSMPPTSHTHGNIQNGGTLQTTDITIASGDKLVVTDSSDSNKIARASIGFDGSTTTKALTPKGTFETFLQTHQSLTAYAKLASPAFTGTPTAPTATAGTNTTQIATTAFVKTAIDNLPEPMVFKGSLGTGGTITALPVDGSATIGDTYKVITAGTYASQSAKIGDTFICDSKTASANTWVLIPSGDEPSGTVTSVTIKATSPIAIDSSAAITSSGTRTLSHANSGVTAGTYRSVTVNATGHITAGTNPTTLSGYGITDAKIASGVITLGSNTITPLTSHQAVVDNDPTLSWGESATVATIGSTDIHVTMPANPNSDTKVKQTITTTNADYRVLFSYTADDTTRTEQARKATTLKFNPSTGALTATKLVGDISSSTGLTSTQVTTALGYTPYNSTNPAGYTSNVGTITGITMNGTSKGTSGVVDLGTVITAHQDISGKADKSATVSTVAYDTTNKKFTKTINGTTTDIAKLATTSVGSASAGTAIAADDITAWTTNTPTAVTPNTVVTGGTKTSIPNISKKTVVTGVTKKTVVTSASGATASVSGCTLTITNGSFSTGDSCTVTTGDSVAVGTAIEAYTSLTTGAACSVTAGTAASLSYTARSIPNISVSSKTVATGFTTA